MQLNLQQFDLRFYKEVTKQTYLYLLGVHDINRQVEGAKHYIAVGVAIMWRHLWCSLGGWGGPTVGWSASRPWARLGGWRGRPLHKVYHLATHICNNRDLQLHLHICDRLLTSHFSFEKKEKFYNIADLKITFNYFCKQYRTNTDRHKSVRTHLFEMDS